MVDVSDANFTNIYQPAYSSVVNWLYRLGRILTRYACCAVLITAFLLPAPLYAAAWTLEKGTGQAINTFSYYNYKDTSSGDSITAAVFNPYIEYGWCDDVTLGISPRFQSESGNGESMSGDVFVRKRLWHNDTTVISVQPLFQLPGSYNPASGGSMNDAQGELRLLIGHSIDMPNLPPLFWDGELAYRTDLNGPGELHIDSTVGVKFTPRWMVLMQVFGTSVQDDTQTTSTTTVDTSGNSLTTKSDISYAHFDTIAQISVVHPVVDDISIQAGVFTRLVDADPGKGNGFIVSIWVNF